MGRAPEESFSNTSIISAGRHCTNKTLTRLFLRMKTIYIYDSIFQPCRTTTGREWGLGTGHPGTVFFRTFPKSVETKNFVTASQPCSGNDRFHCSNQRVVFERLPKMPRLSRFGMFPCKEKTRGHRQKCCTCHEKGTTRSVLTPPCLASILSKMPRLSRFGMFAFGFDPLSLKEDMTLRVRFRPSGRVRFRPPAPYERK